MKKVHNKVTTRQLLSMIIVMMVIKSQDLTPIILFDSGKNATWMYPLLWLIIIPIPLFLILSVLRKYKNKNIIELNYILTGKYIGFILNIILFLLIMSSTILNSRSYVDIMSSMIYKETPITVLVIVLLGTSFYVAVRGLETIARLSYLLVPFIFFSLVVLIIIVSSYVRIEHLFPILGPGIDQIAINGVRHLSLIGEFMILSLIYPYVVDHKSYKRGLISGFTVSCITMSLIFILYIVLFDYIAPQKAMFIYSQVTKFTELGPFVNNLDALFFAIWIYTGILRFSFYIYAAALSLGKILRLKSFEPLLFPLTVLIGILSLIPHNPATTMLILRDHYLVRSSWVVFVFLPIILFILSILKKEEHYENH